MEIIKEIANDVESLTIEINSPSETKSDQSHNGKKIDEIIVSQDMSYAVTYSKDDNSVHGWLVNVEENGQQQPDMYFKLDKSYDIRKFVLYKKILLFSYDDSYGCRKYLF